MLHFLVPKVGEYNIEKGQRGRENGKEKKGGENRRSERGRRGYYGNKVNPLVRENSDFEVSVYHHIIY